VHVVATAGHVDHGKSTLVLALTGTDPDRWAEEKERGLTIDLGFAFTSLPSGREAAFVDVPGHVRFLKNMLAGVGAVDACLFVVAATEGWKPQSEEHLRILDLLGIGTGMVALTKVGLVPPDERELAVLDVREHLAGTFLADAEIVAVDAPSGEGVPELIAALDRLLAMTPEARDLGRPRLWVDRAFAAKGSGTVVTGTLAGGTLRVDDEVEITPGGGRARIRALQSHNRGLEQAPPGRRLAVNLAGIHHDDAARGHAVVHRGQWHLTTMVDCSLKVLSSLDHELSRRGAFQAYIGSGEHPVRLRILGREAIHPGSTGSVRLHLPVALPLLPGDRYVLRESGRGETVGGGEILDVEPVTKAATAAPDRSVERVVSERGWVEADHLERLTGERRPATVGGRWVVSAPALASATERLRAAVAAAGPIGLDVSTLDERDRAVLVALDDLDVSGGRARPAGSDDPLVGHPFLDRLRAQPFSPPSPDGIDRAELRSLVTSGAVVERDGLYFAASAVDEAAHLLAALLVEMPDGLTVAQIRDALGTSRKYLLPLLAHLDANGVTRRRGDLRIAGPRLPTGPA
jgi:selenocysteine-specific elongation factor